MNTLLITGLSGTLGPYVAQHFEKHGWLVINWDHHTTSTESHSQGAEFLAKVQPHAICHLAMGSEEWAGRLAKVAKDRQIPFVFTSTAMVFDASINGPYFIESERNSNDEYGKYKIRCEDKVWQNNSDAIVARLGWQIGDTLGGNNMFEQLTQQHLSQGHIDASSVWYPATSSMSDTASMLFELINKNEPGLYHIDSNANDKLSFYELVQRLAKHHSLEWIVKENLDYQHDQRLKDTRLTTPSLSDWL